MSELGGELWPQVSIQSSEHSVLTIPWLQNLHKSHLSHAWDPDAQGENKCVLF